MRRVEFIQNTHFAAIKFLKHRLNRFHLLQGHHRSDKVECTKALVVDGERLADTAPGTRIAQLERIANILTA